MLDFGLERKRANEKASLGVFNSCGVDRNSKIQNLKWAGLFVSIVALTMCGVVAQAQQQGAGNR
jgi:hypothetical protein